MLKGLYWEKFENGQCGGPSILVLTDSVDRALDDTSMQIKDYEFMERYFDSSKYLNFMLKFKGVPVLSWFITWYLKKRISFQYDITVNYIECHDET